MTPLNERAARRRRPNPKADNAAVGGTSASTITQTPDISAEPRWRLVGLTDAGIAAVELLEREQNGGGG